MTILKDSSPLSHDASNTLEPAIIWGGRGHAKVLNEFLGHVGFRVESIFDNDGGVASPIHGVPIHHGIVGFIRWREQSAHLQQLAAFIAIGGPHGHARLDILELLLQHGVRLPSAIHPQAFVAHNAELGRGCQVLALAAVCAEVTMGDVCIINTGASVDHECELGHGVHIAPHGTITGCVKMEDHVFVGAGAVVLPHLHIGKNSIVGAGSVVTKNVPDGVIVYGNPAKVIRKVAAHRNGA